MRFTKDGARDSVHERQETMRRLILSLSALSLLGMAVGCTHTAGVCDCDGGHHAVAPVMPGVVPEPIKAPVKEAPAPKPKTSLESGEPPIAQ
jgi:hypothetical protein